MDEFPRPQRIHIPFVLHKVDPEAGTIWLDAMEEVWEDIAEFGDKLAGWRKEFTGEVNEDGERVYRIHATAGLHISTRYRFEEVVTYIRSKYGNPEPSDKLDFSLRASKPDEEVDEPFNKAWSDLS